MFNENKDEINSYFTSPSNASEGRYTWAKDYLCTQSSPTEQSSCREYVSRYGDDIATTLFLLLGFLSIIILLRSRRRMFGHLKTKVQRICFISFVLGIILSVAVLCLCSDGSIHGIKIMCCSHLRFELNPIYWYHSSPVSFLFFLLGVLSSISGFIGMFWHAQIASLYSCTIERLISWIRSGS